MVATSGAFAGASKIDISPAGPVPMAGYGPTQTYEGGPPDHAGYTPRVGSSVGVHDPLFARALVLRNQDRTAVLVSLDLVDVPGYFTQLVRTRLEEEAGIPAHCVMLAASHTHSGPNLFRDLRDSADSLPEETVLNLRQEVCTKVAQAVLRAHDSLRPAAFGWGCGSLPEPIVNRRNIERVVDAEVGVLRIEQVDGKPIAVVIHFGCHPNVLGSQSREITADFPGYATSLVEAALGQDAVCLFVNGAAGNINPTVYPYGPERNIDEIERAYASMGKPPLFRSSHAAARRLGNALGGEAIRAAETLRLSTDATVDTHYTKLSIPIKTGDALEERFKHLSVREDIREQVRQLDTVQTEIQGIRIGPGALVGIPGEPFVELGLSLKADAPHQPVFMVGYANDSIGYIPNAVDYHENRYESIAALIGPSGPDMILAVAKKTLRQLAIPVQVD